MTSQKRSRWWVAEPWQACTRLLLGVTVVALMSCALQPSGERPAVVQDVAAPYRERTPMPTIEGVGGPPPGADQRSKEYGDWFNRHASAVEATERARNNELRTKGAINRANGTPTMTIAPWTPPPGRTARERLTDLGIYKSGQSRKIYGSFWVTMIWAGWIGDHYMEVHSGGERGNGGPVSRPYKPYSEYSESGGIQVMEVNQKTSGYLSQQRYYTPAKLGPLVLVEVSADRRFFTSRTRDSDDMYVFDLVERRFVSGPGVTPGGEPPPAAIGTPTATPGGLGALTPTATPPLGQVPLTPTATPRR